MPQRCIYITVYNFNADHLLSCFADQLESSPKQLVYAWMEVTQEHDAPVHVLTPVLASPVPLYVEQHDSIVSHNEADYSTSSSDGNVYDTYTRRTLLAKVNHRA